MAENENGQERTEQPTAKRLQDAKRKGQVARSRELNTMMITLIGGMALVGMSGHFGESMGEMMTGSFTIARPDIYDPMAMLRRLMVAIQDSLLMLAPFFAVIIALAIVSSVALGGITLSTQAMAPKMSKLNPLKGMKRVFSVKGLVELAKALAKFLLVGGATALALWLTLDDFIRLSGRELIPAMVEMGELVGWSFVLISLTLIIIAMADVPFQLWDHKRQLKMTRQEVKEEMKDTEGRPEVKGRIRQLQREFAMRRMMEEVPKADVVVTNPTHYAVALRYDQNRMLAPKVVAKGMNLIAANIREIAEENNVTIVESPMLARAIYFHTELDEFIPAGLYFSVAKILAYVFQLRIYATDGGLKPEAPTDLPIPEDLQVPESDDATLH
ncbi:MAG: flagellar biosynthesis protein FlhB [Candidatus Sedimenticola sp. 6PFRAG7]